MLSLALIATISGVGLDWHAPEQCPDAAQVQARLEDALLGRGLEHASLVVNVVIEANAEGLALTLSIDDGGGPVQHEVVSQACETIVDAIEVQTLMAAMGAAPAEPVDSEPEPVEPEPEPVEPEPEPKPAPEPTSDLVPRALAEPKRKPQLRATAWAELAMGGFRVPELDIRWSVGAGVKRSSWTAELGFSHTLGRRASHPTLGGVAVDVRQWSLVGRGCWSLRRGQLEFPLCGAFEAGAISVIGVGIDRPQRARGPWVAALPRAGLTWAPLERFAAGVAVEGYGALVLSGATVQDEDPWFTPGRIGVAGLVRIELRLP